MRVSGPVVGPQSGPPQPLSTQRTILEAKGQRWAERCVHQPSANSAKVPHRSVHEADLHSGV